MPGALRRAAVYLGLAEEDRSAGDYDQYEGYEETGPVDARPSSEGRPVAAAAAGARSSGSVAYLPERRVDAPAADGMSRITTIHPSTYNEARLIGEHYRDGVPVIMNLSNLDDGDAKRLVDFAAGLVFGLHGTIERVTSKVFLLSPAEVTVTAEDKARIAGGAFFNQS
jgi:cell division inhibitor SepF